MSEKSVLKFDKTRPNPTSQHFPEAQGHEKILATCKKHRLDMRVHLIDGSSLQGVITQFDRWSITIKNTKELRQTIYKHAVKYFEVAA
jgi:RNA chaperone Hfq